ncbi:MAG: dihydrodipicolinate synthase family protein [Chloroflexota bacterium]|nr:dihydrodipicolinate synthase family protein [Chloroflexota bacterium]
MSTLIQSETGTTLRLPQRDGNVREHRVGPASPYATSFPTPTKRIAYAAAHVVADPMADTNPSLDTAIDWDATLHYRRYLWSLGLRVAEAMDTAQRGMGLDWPTSRELIRRSIAEARTCDGQLASGAGTDHLVPDPSLSLDAIVAAYEEQCEFVEGEGGQIILMASRALAAAAKAPDDYAVVYDRILSQVSQPVIIHWLGDMFDPALAGYWGSDDLDVAMDRCLAVLQAHEDKIDGIKISLLDKDREIAMRRRLPDSIRMYTGDDFNYSELIEGDEQGYSDALLGIFDAIAPAAGAAFAAFDAGDVDRYRAILEPTMPLSRHIFTAPTRFYKTGVVFLAWLNGHQTHFHMVGGQQSARSVVHLSELFTLADEAHLFHDPDEASRRMRAFLTVAGVEQS